jgi:MoaA/NifB/PqqE/SkfB family radical SAM enzyme
MDLSVILTYRCNSKCSMCYIWKYPTHPNYEIDLKTLEKLPRDIDYLNLTGGEPTLREDLEEICDLLFPKARQLEISTNGLKSDTLVPIVKKYPSIKVRISLEAIGEQNDIIRGEKDGYKKKIEGMKKLIEAGGLDLGFATTFQDENINYILDIFGLTKELKIEMATSALHNAFQFHKNDNFIYERLSVAKKVENLITEMLRSDKPKDWFRAYMNLGLIRKILGQDRLHPCTQGTDSVFIDPWADVYACNVRNDLYMGNLKDQDWDDIYYGDLANEVRKKVSICPQNCWMVSSAKTSMRMRLHPKVPKPNVLLWVIINKTRVSLGLSVPFERYIDYNDIKNDSSISRREYYLFKHVKKVLQPSKSNFYTMLKEYFNR